MSVSTHKRLTIALGVACVGLLVLCACLFWSYGWLKTQQSGNLVQRDFDLLADWVEFMV